MYTMFFGVVIGILTKAWWDREVKAGRNPVRTFADGFKNSKEKNEKKDKEKKDD